MALPSPQTHLAQGAHGNGAGLYLGAQSFLLLAWASYRGGAGEL